MAVSDISRERHTELILAAIRAEAFAERIDDAGFRGYVVAMTDGLDLPGPGLTVLPGGNDAA